LTASRDGDTVADREKGGLKFLYAHDESMVEEKSIEPVPCTAEEFVLMHRAPGQSRSMILGRLPLLG
jgi:hypothetical protein